MLRVLYEENLVAVEDFRTEASGYLSPTRIRIRLALQQCFENVVP